MNQPSRKPNTSAMEHKGATKIQVGNFQNPASEEPRRMTGQPPFTQREEIPEEDMPEAESGPERGRPTSKAKSASSNNGGTAAKRGRPALNRVADARREEPAPIPMEPARMHNHFPFCQRKEIRKEDAPGAGSGKKRGRPASKRRGADTNIEVTPAKRGRGRPASKRSTSNQNIVAAPEGELAPIPNEPKRKRGRPPLIRRDESLEDISAPVPPQPRRMTGQPPFRLQESSLEKDLSEEESGSDGESFAIKGRPTTKERGSAARGRGKRSNEVITAPQEESSSSNRVEITESEGTSASNQERLDSTLKDPSSNGEQPATNEQGPSTLGARGALLPESNNIPSLQNITEPENSEESNDQNQPPVQWIAIQPPLQQLAVPNDAEKPAVEMYGVRKLYLMPRLLSKIEYRRRGGWMRATLHACAVWIFDDAVRVMKAEAVRAGDHRSPEIQDLGRAAFLLLKPVGWIERAFHEIWNDSFDDSEDPRNALCLDNPEFLNRLPIGRPLPEKFREDYFLNMLREAIRDKRYSKSNLTVVPNLPPVDVPNRPIDVLDRPVAVPPPPPSLNHHVPTSSFANGSTRVTRSSSNSGSFSATTVSSLTASSPVYGFPTVPGSSSGSNPSVATESCSDSNPSAATGNSPGLISFSATTSSTGTAFTSADGANASDSTGSSSNSNRPAATAPFSDSNSSLPTTSSARISPSSGSNPSTFTGNSPGSISSSDADSTDLNMSDYDLEHLGEDMRWDSEFEEDVTPTADTVEMPFTEKYNKVIEQFELPDQWRGEQRCEDNLQYCQNDRCRILVGEEVPCEATDYRMCIPCRIEKNVKDLPPQSRKRARMMAYEVGGLNIRDFQSKKPHQFHIRDRPFGILHVRNMAIEEFIKLENCIEMEDWLGPEAKKRKFQIVHSTFFDNMVQVLWRRIYTGRSIAQYTDKHHLISQLLNMMGPELEAPEAPSSDMPSTSSAHQ
ncbi:hypothetical protein CAEBREN_11395 [Caenorhabditis brenneri]|uniref:Uncharacterized protein n=1 Tax=Caenorhabditis brenneri TaxID=135651 RepID=G0NY60_CAEBE|nr:hypothetical protein CAEBREN_11395 [Caenorhabditis brenneri]